MQKKKSHFTTTGGGKIEGNRRWGRREEHKGESILKVWKDLESLSSKPLSDRGEKKGKKDEAKGRGRGEGVREGWSDLRFPSEGWKERKES